MPSNLYQHAKTEFDILIENDAENDLVITPFIPQLLALVDAFGKSGQSGGSAPFTARCICVTLEKLLAFKPLGPLTGEESEWNDVSSLGSNPAFQNNRCSHIFKNANGVAYNTDGYMFWHWSERDLDKDEAGYPGTIKYKSYFTSGMSRKLVEFPYTIPERTEIEVECYEVNKESGAVEKGSGWWHTIYPEWLIQENSILQAKLDQSSS